MELFALNLINSIWAIKKDEDEQDLKYTVVFYLYERLLNINSNFDSYVTLKMKKPKKVTKEVLNFFK